jgi:archaellum component FlaC
MDVDEINNNDPIIIDIVQRISRLEAQYENIEKSISFLKEKIGSLEERVEKVDSRTWWILGGIAISILIQILLRLI